MKSNFSFLNLATLVVLTLMAFGARLGAQIYEYDWIGGESGFSGKIFLNAPSSASAPDGGTIADVLTGSYLTTPLGTFNIFDSAYSQETYPIRQNLAWNQTHITVAMLFFKSPTVVYDPYFGWPAEGVAQVGWGVANGLENAVVEGGGAWATQTAEDDFSGQWLAVPEPTTFMLMATGVLALVARRKSAIK